MFCSSVARGVHGKRRVLSTFTRINLEFRLMVVSYATRHIVFENALGSPWPYRLPVSHASLFQVCCRHLLSRLGRKKSLTSSRRSGRSFRHKRCNLMTTASNPMAFAGQGLEPASLYRVPISPSLDGNTVELHVEQVQFAENATRYEATLQFLNGRIKNLRSALRGE